MFRGISKVSLDAKGRFAIPKRFREPILSSCGGHLVLTADAAYPCLVLFTLPHWENLEKELASLPSFNQNARNVQRMMIGHAEDVEMDGQGRVLVPVLHREMVQLEKSLVLSGQSGRFEIWAEDAWQDRLESWRDPKVKLSEDEEPDPVLNGVVY